jgi:hypothetical protein
MEFTLEKQKIPKVSQFLGSKKYKICWKKTLLKKGHVGKGGHFGLN